MLRISLKDADVSMIKVNEDGDTVITLGSEVEVTIEAKLVEALTR